MEVVIFYTSRERELQNACLLKSELVKRGHNVYILDSFYLNTINEKLSFLPDIILTPYLYTEDQFCLFKNIYKDKMPRIINLQYEQIFSESEIYNNLQIPYNKMKNAIHICWNNKWREKLIEQGVPEENSVLLGSISIDLCRDRFNTIYTDREYLSKKHNLKYNKKWIIFISSFVFADITDDWKNFHYKNEFWGKKRTDERINIDTDSRNAVLYWILRYIKENDCEFIYRPHPSEEVNDKLYELEEFNNNFHIIRDDSVRTWIRNCDKIHTWYSTSIVDIYFMGKNCSILRPIDLPNSMHNDLLNSGKFTRTYDEFYYFNNNKVNEFPVNKDLILNEFYIDKKEYAYEKICNLIEEIVKKDLVMDLY